MNKKLLFTIIILAVVVFGYVYLAYSKPFKLGQDSPNQKETYIGFVDQALAAQFDYLSKNGNSSCSGSFKDSIVKMPDNARLQGSCCSPMSVHRYSEQVEGLKEFKSIAGQDIAGIPNDPYDIEAGLAKKLMFYYDMQLTPEEQKAYDYAMFNSNEKGPCCCKCWRWYVYGGLGKYLIRNYGFTGEQVTDIWNLSDGCGGDEEHQH